MANSYKFEISQSISSPFTAGELFQRKHFHFDSANRFVFDKSLHKLTAKKLLQMDFGTKTVERKHYCFNDDNSIINKSLIPMTAEELLELDINLFTSNNNDSNICLDKKDPVQEKYSFFNKYFKEVGEQQLQTSVVKMPENYLSFYNLQSIKNRLVNLFGNNCIIKKHLYFNEDGDVKGEIESFTVEEFLDNNMKISSFKSNHFLNKNIDDSKEASNMCLTNKPPSISKDTQKRNFSDLNNKDLFSSDEFTSLKNIEENFDLDIETRCSPFFKLGTNTRAQMKSNINNSFSFKDHNDSLHEEINLLDISRDSGLVLNSDCKQPYFKDENFLNDKFIKQYKAKVSTNPLEDLSFKKLTFKGGNTNKFLLNKTEIIPEERKCPIIFCQMRIKLPNKHFKQHHPQLPKWKKKVCRTLIHLNSRQDKRFPIHKCIFCNSSEVDIIDHLCQMHHLSPNSELNEEVKNQCELVFLNSDELFYETMLDAFRLFQKSHGFKRRSIAKQVAFLKYLLAGLSDRSATERIFIGRLLASNMYPIVNTLFMQRHFLNRLLQKQLKIWHNFLKFLHSNSDIFASLDKSWHENVLPSWNVLEINENKLVLVSCKD